MDGEEGSGVGGERLWMRVMGVRRGLSFLLERMGGDFKDNACMQACGELHIPVVLEVSALVLTDGQNRYRREERG